MNKVISNPVTKTPRGVYETANDFKAPEMIRGSIQFAVDVLKRQWQMQPLNFMPFNQCYDASNYTDFSTQVLVNGSISGAEPLKYVFYGDVVLTAFSDPDSVNDDNVSIWTPKNFKDKSLGLITCGYAYSAAAGAGVTNVENYNNLFVHYLNITDNNSGGGGATNLKNTAKFEGFIIKLN